MSALPPLEVLCEDGPVLAVNKPAGLLTQGAPQGSPTLESIVRSYIKRKYDKPGNVYLGIPHRLDRPTSGVIVFARNSKAAARLAEQFHDRQVRKEYVAVVDAVPDVPEATLSDWLLKDPDRSHVERVAAGTPGAKLASLHYRILQQHEGRTLLHVELHTGRMHQIRVQLSGRGWPIVGDGQYGFSADGFRGDEAPPDDTVGENRSTFPIEAIALHAHRLTLRHPIRYDSLTISAPLPQTWSGLGFEVV